MCAGINTMIAMAYDAISVLALSMNPQLKEIFVNWVGCAPGRVSSLPSDEVSTPPPAALQEFTALSMAAAMKTLTSALDASRNDLVSTGKYADVLARLGLGGPAHRTSPMLIVMHDDHIFKVILCCSVSRVCTATATVTAAATTVIVSDIAIANPTATASVTAIAIDTVVYRY